MGFLVVNQRYLRLGVNKRLKNIALLLNSCRRDIMKIKFYGMMMQVEEIFENEVYGQRMVRGLITYEDGREEVKTIPMPKNFEEIK